MKRIVSALMALILALSAAGQSLASGEPAETEPPAEAVVEIETEPEEPSGEASEPELEAEEEPEVEPEPETEQEPEAARGYDPAYELLATNPFYEADASAEELARSFAVAAEELPLLTDGEGEPLTEEAAVEVIRAAMEARAGECVVTVPMESASQRSVIAARMLWSAFEHTGVPTQGDYIRWHYKQVYAGYRWSASLLTITYGFTYYTTGEQEDEVGEVIERVTSGTEGMSDYKKLKTLYDYVCKNVRYDYNFGEYCYSAYGAAVLNKCVCQGYASFLYRGLLSMGLDCRLIPGTSGTEAHGWNLVRLDGRYYYIDATWDRGRTSYVYFLKGRPFSGHTNDQEFDSDAFYAAYNVATADYLSAVGAYDDLVSLAAVLDARRDEYMLLVRPRDGLIYGALLRGHDNFAVLGDGMRDGKLNILDVGFMIGYILGGIERDGWHDLVCDINGDGSVNVADIELLVRYVSGRSDTYDY